MRRYLAAARCGNFSSGRSQSFEGLTRHREIQPQTRLNTPVARFWCIAGICCRCETEGYLQTHRQQFARTGSAERLAHRRGAGRLRFSILG